jgi:hypothetical protein
MENVPGAAAVALLLVVVVAVSGLGLGIGAFQGSSIQPFGAGSAQAAPASFGAFVDQPPPMSYPVSFSETGLPPGLTWSVTFNGTPMSSPTGPGFVMLNFPPEPNGNYSYSIAGNPGYHQNTIPYQGNLTVNGSPLMVGVTYAPVVYNITFSEAGLAAGMTWGVNVNGLPMSLVTNGSTDSLTWTGLANASYSYTIAGIPGWYQNTLPYSGSVTVDNGSNVEPTLLYSQATYSVSFSERGLPSGQLFQVTVNGVPESLTANGGTDTLTFTGLINGTYSYSIADISGWHQTTLAYMGSVTVNGLPVSEPTLAYAQVTYSVLFEQGSLPSGTEWYVNITSGPSESSKMADITWSEPNGTYDFTVASADKRYMPSPASGQFPIEGAGYTQVVEFGKEFYPVTFTESGLPNGTVWYLNLTDGTSVYNDTNTISFEAIDGPYDYSVATTDKEFIPVPESGSFSVNGGPIAESVTFYQTNFTVTFTATNLTGSADWYVNFTSGPSGFQPKNGTAIGSSPIVSILINGTYNYSVSTTDKEYAAAGGSFTVAGQDLSLTVLFVPYTYKVTFNETGLPTGARWYVNITSPHHQGRGSINSTIIYYLTNGTHNYTVAAADKIYSPAPTNIPVVVNGSAVNATVTIFRELMFDILFEETGLPAGANWSVTIAGTTNSSTTSTIGFSEPNGTYGFNLAPIATYVSTPANASLTVAGKPVVEFIAFASAPMPFHWSYLLAGAAAAVVLAALVVFALGRGKKPPTGLEPPLLPVEEPPT